MFEDAIKALENLKSLSIPIEEDEKGYIDKQCPAEGCEFTFKLHKEHLESVVSNDNLFCPFCRHEAPSDSWYTIEQIEKGKEEAFNVAKNTFQNALKSGADKFNRRHNRKGFISMSMSVQGGTRQTHPIPIKAADEMQLEIDCEGCSAKFAVIGSAYFCPVCGHNSATQTFSDSLRKIKAKKDNLNVVRLAIEDSAGKDEAALTCRSILETCINDGVMAFQRYCEGIYAQFGEPPFNAFQRIHQIDELWLKATGEGLRHWLDDEELKSLNTLYNKRHILSHNEGLVDEKYLSKSGDDTYKEGQRIVVLEGNIDVFVGLLEKMKAGIESAIEAKSGNQSRLSNMLLNR